MPTDQPSALAAATGARLYTEIAGDGPPLLLIPGGGGDAASYRQILPLLADWFTVIGYDRRGNSRSPLEWPDAPVDIGTQADDAIRVLDHHDIDRAAIFGSSAGALIALELLCRHPDRIEAGVVHEPPLVSLLHDGPERAELETIRRIAETEGAIEGFVAFAAMTMPRPPGPLRSQLGRALTAAGLRAIRATGTLAARMTGRPPGGMIRLLGNAEILLHRELPSALDYRPDLAALRAIAARWRPVTGAQSVGRPYHRPAHVLADKLGLACLEFPGGHAAYQQQPVEFAERLLDLVNTLGR